MAQATENGMLRSGEFATLCGTTKDTLRHYEAMGLLAPAAVAANGYKLYGPAQATDFLIISSLAEAGMPLARIGALLAGNERELADAMSERATAIAKQIAELERKRALLEASAARIGELSSWQDDVGQIAPGSYRVRNLPEATFIKTDLPGAYDFEGTMAAIADHKQYCAQHGVSAEAGLFSVMRIARPSFASGDYATSLSLLTRANASPECERTHIRPAGRYLQRLTALPLSAANASAEDANPAFESYDALRTLLAKEDYAIAGDVYDEEISLGTLSGTDILWTETTVAIQ